MANVLHSWVSVVHLAAVVAALATGTYVVLTPKGTLAHRRVGRAYAASMAVVLLTAFGIYALFGRFGIVHWGAVGSAGALAAGVGAVVLRPGPAWRQWHYFGMGASVTGLYAALAVESTYRFFPPACFWWVTLGLAAAVFLTGGLLLHRHCPAWPSPLIDK